jgi:serine phosphatase RsbU (regulator of sigma subunit)
LGIIKRFFSYKVIQEKNRIEQIAEDRTKEIEKQKDDLKKLAIDLKEKNEIVFQQNKELNKRREEIETLYDKLTSSITYGKGIKDALLPSENDLKNIFPNSFHFFNPQNILGGDFYWIAKNNNRKILIVGDASGQGVSGAFLSLFAISMFNNINFDTSTKAASILKSLNNGIHKHFSNYLKNIDDGFELAVVIFDENDNNQRIKIEFSSANIPLYYFESDQVLNMKKLEANDFCVRADINALSFATQTVEVPKGTMLYLATKGLSQQIGGDREETFGKSKLKANLMKIHVLEIEKQKEIITQTFEKWKGINEQTDDVLFVGVRI